MDFVKNLETDMSLAILSRLDDPSDLVRASAVSRSWRHFVIKQSLSKNLCLKLFHQLTSVDRILEEETTLVRKSERFWRHGAKSPIARTSTLRDPIASQDGLELTFLLQDTQGARFEAPWRSALSSHLLASSRHTLFRTKETTSYEEEEEEEDTRRRREHRVYASLAKGCTSSPIQSCIQDAIAASSTDRLPAESIFNTLDERDRVGRTPSYWSSAGHHNPSVPETLLYHLKADLCLITQLSIHPFQVYYYPGSPICSSHYVRFRFGHLDNHSHDKNNNYVWTYTSPQFPLAQENRLQNFKLPDPVICIGGYLLVEFLGRAQICDADDLYYICVTHVKAMGRSLAKSFRVVDPDESGLKVLSYSDPQKMNDKEEEEAGPSVFRGPMRNRDVEQIVNFLYMHPTDDVQYVSSESDEEEEV